MFESTSWMRIFRISSSSCIVLTLLYHFDGNIWAFPHWLCKFTIYIWSKRRYRGQSDSSVIPLSLLKEKSPSGILQLSMSKRADVSCKTLYVQIASVSLLRQEQICEAIFANKYLTSMKSLAMQECIRERKENVLHTWDINGRNSNQISQQPKAFMYL